MDKKNKVYIIVETSAKLKTNLDFCTKIIGEGGKVYLLFSDYIINNLPEIDELVNQSICRIPNHDNLSDYLNFKLNTITENHIEDEIYVSTNDEMLLAEYYSSIKISNKEIVFGPQKKETLNLLFNKEKIRKKLFHTAIRQPKTLKIKRGNETKMPLPFIMKPKVGSGCFETYMIKNIDRWNSITKNIDDTRIAENIYEEYVEGDLYHYDVVANNGEILFDTVCKYSYPCLDTVLYSKSLGSFVLLKSDHEYADICSFGKNIFENSTSNYSGCCHIEIIKSKNNHLFFLELNARAPGGMIPEMYRQAFYLDIQALHYLAQFNLLSKVESSYFKPAAWIWNMPRAGYIKAIKKIDLESIISFMPRVSIGDKVEKPGNIRDRIGAALLTNKSFTKLKDDFYCLSEEEVFIYE